jgi:transcriptional regulator of arginine metabolism
MNMSKALQRHNEITRIIREGSVSSQQEIVDLLARKGLAVTQPTLSRDLRELGVAKTPEGYVLPDEIVGSVAHFAPRQSRQDRFESTVRELVVSAVVSGTIVVLRTPPAEAQPVARAIDEADISAVAGSIGGDDTIFVAMTSAKAARDFTRRINSIVSATSRRRRTHA